MSNREAEPAQPNREHQKERDLLCACIQMNAGDSGRERVNGLLRAELDWPYLMATAQRHALGPLLYQRLQICDWDLTPEPYQQKLKTIYLENVARNLVLLDELLSIARDFRAQGIDCLPFKGPVLGLTAYSDPALRQSADLDILVLPKDLVKARDCLNSKGYRAATEVDPRQERLLIRKQHNIQFTRNNDHLLVELHWRVAPKLFARGMGAEELWLNLETMKVQDVELKSLQTSELLLALCIHGARHLWERMSWVCDIAGVLLQTPELDWPQLLKRARETDNERMLLLGLCLARDFAAASLPQEVEQGLASDAEVDALAQNIAARWFEQSAQVTHAQTAREQMRLRRRWGARARYLSFAMTPNEEDFSRRSLPQALNFLYYALRPGRLLMNRRPEARPNE